MRLLILIFCATWELSKSDFSGSLDLSRYYSYSEVSGYLTDLSRARPSLVQLSVLGQSYEKRNIYQVVLCDGPNKPTVIIDANMEAKAWTTTTTALYAISQIAEVGNNTDICDALRLVIVPQANPDGYEYTRTKTVMWYKTRSESHLVKGCFGAEIDKNFDFEWDVNENTTDPCGLHFKGLAPYSEDETQIIRDVILKNSAKFYLSLNHYGRNLMFPYHFDARFAENWRLQDQVAQAGRAAGLKYNGKEHKTGPGWMFHDFQGGTGADFAYAVADVPISIKYDLPGSMYTEEEARIHDLTVEGYAVIRGMLLEVARIFAH